jgi:hypothetical protein
MSFEPRDYLRHMPGQPTSRGDVSAAASARTPRRMSRGWMAANPSSSPFGASARSVYVARGSTSTPRAAACLGHSFGADASAQPADRLDAGLDL